MWKKIEVNGGEGEASFEWAQKDLRSQIEVKGRNLKTT